MLRPAERFAVNVRPDLAPPPVPARAAARAAEGAAGWRALALLAAAGTVIGLLVPLP